MASKEKKTSAELKAMMMNETRAHTVFKDVIDVTISPTEHGPSNWTAEFTFAATQSGPWPVCPEANKLLQLFQDDFELA
jgi:hypothetical protein